MKYLISIILIILIGLGIGYYYYTKPNSSLAGAKADYNMTADELFTSFEKDENAANIKYLDKVIEVSGKIQNVNNDSVNGKSVSLQTASGMFGVTCKLDSTISEDVKFINGQEVKIKGLCTGMLMDVILVRSIPVNE